MSRYFDDFDDALERGDEETWGRLIIQMAQGIGSKLGASEDEKCAAILEAIEVIRKSEWDGNSFSYINKVMANAISNHRLSELRNKRNILACSAKLSAEPEVLEELAAANSKIAKRSGR